MKIIKILVSALFVFAFSVQGTLKVSAGMACDTLTIDSGSGHYLISTAVDFQTMACRVNMGDALYQTGIYDLQNDIDLASASWVPIGTTLNPFKGEFNGNSHVLNHLTITALTTTHQTYNGFIMYGTGLFGSVEGGNIHHLMIQNASIDVRSNVLTFMETQLLDLSLIGVVAASANLESTIDHVLVKEASITVTNPSMMEDTTTSWPFTYVGGIVGRLAGTSSIEDSFFTGTINVSVSEEDYQSMYLGGLAGGIEDSGIESSWIDADLSFSSPLGYDLNELVVGGLTGYAWNSGITDSGVKDALIDVNSDTDSAAAGGIAGSADAVTIIEQALFNGTLDSSTNNVGGIVGFVQSPQNVPNGMTPQNGYFLIMDTNNATGILKGHNSVGGLIGKTYYAVKIINNWFEGSISGHNNLGGLIGEAGECRVDLMTSYSLGYLTGSNNLGGLIGMGYSENILTDVFSRMNLIVTEDLEVVPQASSLYDIGGIAAYDYGTYSIYTNVYFAGKITNSGGLTLGKVDPISNFASNPISTTAIYYDHDLFPMDSDTGTPKTTAELKLFSAYLGFTLDDPWFIDPRFNEGYAYFDSGYYRVVIDNGTTPYGYLVRYLALINRPSTPTRSGYVFGGWYTDQNFTTTWDFNLDEVTNDVTLYAKWTESTPDTGEAANYGYGFLGLSLILLAVSRRHKTQA